MILYVPRFLIMNPIQSYMMLLQIWFMNRVAPSIPNHLAWSMESALNDIHGNLRRRPSLVTMVIRCIGVDHQMTTVELSQQKWKEWISLSITVGLFHIRHLFLKRSRHKTHCNVEYCNSVKSIKYICKYVTKGSDMAVFGLQSSNTNDEISRYQVGRYVNCNEAIWRIFAFPIHERHPTVVHLAVHLKNSGITGSA